MNNLLLEDPSFIELPLFVTSQDHLLINNATYNISALLLHSLASSHSNNNNNNDNNMGPADGPKFLFESPYITMMVAIIAALMSLVTIIGNVLVITAFIIDKKLRSYSNYFILNLSIADLLIGLLIPPYAPFLLYNYNWMLGSLLCTTWLVLDYVVGSASVLCIVVISLDRYWMVSRGLKYLTNQKISHAIFIMLTVWTIAFMNYAPAIVFWELISPNGNKTMSENECQVGFHDNLGYLTATACVEFFLPFISICSLNLAVYLNIRERSKGLIRTKVPESVNKGKSRMFENSTTDCGGVVVVEEQRKHSVKKLMEPSDLLNAIAQNVVRKSSNASAAGDAVSNGEAEVLVLQNMRSWRTNNEGFIKKDKNLTKDKKAARSLFILVFTFVVCWVIMHTAFKCLFLKIRNNKTAKSIFLLMETLLVSSLMSFSLGVKD